MITVAKATSAGYYTDGNGGSGMESYYLDAVTEGEPPGKWRGSGAGLLGLSGVVTPEAMETLFEDFVNPVTGEQLGGRPAARAKVRELVAAALAAEPDASAERRAQIRAGVSAGLRQNVIGWDLTLAVPKSVTILHTAATRGMIAASRAGDTALEEAHRWLRDSIDAAIEDANLAALRAVEAITTARAGGGQGAAMRWEQAQAMVFASFPQHTSRSIEPHLHVHNVALNRVLCGDGKWRAIDGQDLLASRFAFSAVGDRALAEGMASRLGVLHRARGDGAGMEAAIVPEASIEAWSTRNHQVAAGTAPLVEAFVQRYGREPTGPELASIKTEAQRTSRASKDHADQTSDELNDTWFEGLKASAGEDLDVLGAVFLGSALDQLPSHLRDALPAQQVAAVRAAAGRAYAALPAPLRDSAAAAAAAAGEAGGEGGQELVAGLRGVWSARAVIEQAVAGCAARSATWGRANLMLEIERTLPVLGIGPGDVEDFLGQLTDQALAWSGVVQVTHPHPGGGAQDAGAAGGAAAGAGPETPGEAGAAGDVAGPLYAPRSAALYAAAATLAAEAGLRAAAVERGRHALEREQVAAWLDEHAPKIGADQRAAVEGIASSDAALTVLVGPAGTGKSFAAGSLAAAWSELTGGSGRVVGLAVSQVATDVLRDDGIGWSRNIARWLATQDRLTAGSADQDDQQWKLGPLDVVMVDEASMVSTADFAVIRALTGAAGARLVAAGDPRQLGPVEAGGVMDLLDGHAETYTLSEVRRFSHDWERAASLAIRDGGEGALDEYERHARLNGYPSVQDAALAAAEAAVADRVAGRSVVVVTASNDQAAAVAARVRDQLIGLGLVSGEGGVLLGRDRNTASPGDVITCRRNDYALGVTNRVQYRVLAAPGQDTRDERRVPEGALLVEPVPVPGRPVPDGGPVLLPAGYVAADVQLGYASTVHSAQGLTVDAAHLVAGGGAGLDAATLYVGMTRGRDRNTAHVALATPAKPSAPAAGTPGGGEIRLEDDTVAESARAVLATGLAGAGAAGLRHLPGPGAAATVAAERDAAVQGSMATLTARIEDETRSACRARLEAHLDDAVHDGLLDEATRVAIGADQGGGHLSGLLRVLEQDGADPRTVLHHALAGKSLTGANSPAQVLSHRITKGRPDHALTDPAPQTGTRIPAGIPPPTAARLTELQERAAARAGELGRAAAEQGPQWAVQALGPVPALTATASPQAAADRADWEHRAGLVAAHREAAGYTDPDRALPRMPGLTSTERRAGYAAAWHALGQPEDTLAEAAMSEGRLRNRIQAWEREQGWQPRYADALLRQTEADLQTARQAAALAAARAEQADRAGEAGQAAKWRTEAATHHESATLKAAAAASLTRDAEAYTHWAFHTAVTRDHAERARAEAERRGINPGTLPGDATTTEDWLTHQTEAITAEDEWRPITEADLADVNVTTRHQQDDIADLEPTDPDSADASGGDAEDEATHIEATPAEATDSEAADSEAADSEAADGEAAGVEQPGTQAMGVEALDPGSSGPARVPQPREPVPTAAELEAMSAGTAAVLGVLADRASQEAAHTAAAGEDLAIEAYDAGRRRRELADLDTALTAGNPRAHVAGTTSSSDAATADDADCID